MHVMPAKKIKIESRQIIAGLLFRQNVYKAISFFIFSLFFSMFVLGNIVLLGVLHSLIFP
jgi:hypothetical protein